MLFLLSFRFVFQIVDDFDRFGDKTTLFAFSHSRSFLVMTRAVFSLSKKENNWVASRLLKTSLSIYSRTSARQRWETWDWTCGADKVNQNSTLISRENCRFFGWKSRENVVVLDFLAVDNFDFTRKIVKKIFGWKTRENVGVRFCQNWIFGQKFDF